MENKRLKIAILNAYQMTSSRGAEVFVTEISKRLSKNQTVDVLSGRVKYSPRVPILWRLFLDLNGLKILTFSIKAIPKLLKGYDIIIPTNGGFQTLITKIVATISKAKVVVSGQSGIGWDDRINIMLKPDAFVSISKEANTWACNLMDQKYVSYIPNGVDLSSFKQSGVKTKLELDKPVILAVGALVPQKRLDLVIKAVSKIPDVSLLVVGDGPLKNKLSALGNEILPGRFEIKSAKHSDMPAIYRSADLFTLTPEKSEAFGIVFVEAMATNLPVVTINDQTRRDIIGSTGLFVDNPTDSNAYADVLKKALSTKWGDKPRNQAEKFSWDEIAQKYEEVFLDLVQK